MIHVKLIRCVLYLSEWRKAITLGCAAIALLVAVLAVVLIKRHQKRRGSSVVAEESEYPVEDARASYRIKYRKNSMRGMAFSIRNATQLLQSEGYLQSPEYMQSKSCPTAVMRDKMLHSGTTEAILFLTKIAARLKAQGEIKIDTRVCLLLL